VDEMFSRPFDLLLGRKTYDIFAAHWPYAGADDPIGKLFDRIAKHVASRFPDVRLGWKNSHWLGSDPVAALRRMKAEDGPDLLTQGSTDFLQTLFAKGLVDEVNLFVFPLVLGRGKRLFGDGAMPAAMKLVASGVSGSGVTISRYEVDGEVATGSFEFEQPTEAELERRRNLT